MQNDVVLVSDSPKRRRFLSYRDEKTSFQQSEVPTIGTLVPGQAEMQNLQGGEGGR